MQEKKFDTYVHLLQKYYSGELTSAEREVLAEILQSDKHLQKIYQELNAGEIISEKCEEYERFDAGRAFKDFCRRENLHSHRKIVFRMLAVAMVALLIGVSSLFVFYQTDKPAISVVVNEIIQPGSCKAILRLANGKTVNFDKDSIQVRELDGTQINYSDGRIAYQNTGGVSEHIYNELIVPMAGECYIILDDGSKVWINADSKLRYPVKFSASERKVYLEGEAYFEVNKSESPFIVATERGDIAVLGTGFGVSAYSGKAEYTTLVHGKVSYTSKKRDCVMLAPGEQAVLDNSGCLSKHSVDVEEYVGWKDGIFVFNNKPLEEIMEILRRWYNVEIVFENNDMKQLRYTGKLERYGSINMFLQLLERLQEIHYKIKGNTILLSNKHKIR